MYMYIYGERTENISIAVPETKKEIILERFYKLLEEYHDPKMLALEKKLKENKKIYDGFSTSYEVQDEAPNISKKIMSEIFTAAKPKTIKNILDLDYESFLKKQSIEVSALPKDKKRISPGLYSGGGKFYTNKIVENQLQILEWENRESAEEYLSNLK